MSTCINAVCGVHEHICTLRRLTCYEKAGTALPLPPLLSSPLLFKWKALNPDAQPGKTLFQEQHLASWQALRVSCSGSFAVVSLGSVTCLRCPGLPGWHVQAAASSSLFTFGSENHFPVLLSCRTHFSPAACGPQQYPDKMHVSLLSA